MALNEVNRKEITKYLLTVNDETRLDYERRLSLEYEKGGITKSFLDQFLRGGGNELNEKFWKRNSSSRLCFELFSWAGADPDCVDAELEYKLPGIISCGKEIHPNMDAMIETESDIWLIESKFTETVDNRKYGLALPEAYWKERDGNRNECQDGGYYYNADRSKFVGGKYPLLKRYGGRSELLPFKDFCEESNREASKLGECDGVDWFDAKQETCHLFGVLRFLLEGKNRGKKVHLVNTVFGFKDECLSDFAKDFIFRSQNLVREITGNSSFDYLLRTSQDVLRRYGDRKAYGVPDRSVREQVGLAFFADGKGCGFQD